MNSLNIVAVDWLRRFVLWSLPVVGVLAFTGEAFAAAIIIDNFSGTNVGTRSFVGNQGGGIGTAPTLTLTPAGGGAIRMQPQNSIVSGTLTYTPGGTIDLTGGGTNDQFLVEFISVIADNGLPLQGLSNLSITVNTTTGARQKAGLGITNGQGNMAFPFTTFTGTGNFSQVTSIVLAFFSQTNQSAGWGTITLDRVWASPPAGAVPTAPSPNFTALSASPTGISPINFTLAFNNNQGAAPIAGLASGDLVLSGSALPTTATITGSGASYNVAVSGMSTDGTVIVTLGANTITDLWLQANASGATSPTINYVRPPVFSNGPPPNSATVGTAYSFNYTATGQGPITYSLFSGSVPTGLTLSGAGALSGTPTVAGTFLGVTRATNVASTNQNFSINVVCPSLTLNPISLPSGSVTVPYSQALSVTGAAGAFNFVVSGGALPQGLTLSGGGILSGTPTGVGGVANFTVTATGPGAGTCTATRAYSVTIVGTFNVTPSVAVGGTIMPNTPVAVSPGATTSFTITSPSGFAPSVSGTCGGILAGNVYTTNAVNAACTVVANFVPLPILTGVESRKAHGVSGTLNLPVTTGIAVTGNVSVEPRIGKNGHLIVFKFDQVLTSEGAVSSVDQNGAPIGMATVVRSGSEAQVTLTGIPDGQRVKILLANAASANGPVSVEVSLAFLVGDISGSRAVNAADISTVKARNNAAVTVPTAKFDINADGAINASDVSAVKARSGVALP